MATVEPYATTAELADFWRTLTATETTRAASLLTFASNRLRQTAVAQGFNLDTKISEDTDGILASNVKWVVLEVVKRAMQTPQDTPPVDSWQQTAGPYSESIKFTNPAGDLWFKKIELATIGLNGAQKLTSIKTTRGDIYDDTQSI